MLEGIRVLELGVWVAGPAAGGVMADWGADVVKVEAPEGEPMRWLFGRLGVGQSVVPPFELDNRGKRSVVLDLRAEPDRARFEELLAEADVFLTNLRPDALERLDLDPAAVRERYPTLVVAAVSGYGAEGPDRDRAGYDVGAFWARSGVAARIAPPGHVPPALPSGFGDHTTAISTVAGICAALFQRARTGEGCLVETSLLRTGMWCLGWDLSIHQHYGRIASTRSRTSMAAPLINCYQAGDGKWFWLLGLEQDRHWPRTLEAIDRLDLADDERFATAASRMAHSAAVIAELDAAFATRSLDHWVERFDAADVWWAPVQTFAEVLSDPQAAASGAIVPSTTPRADGTSGASIANPVSFDRVPLVPGPPPALGEHDGFATS